MNVTYDYPTSHLSFIINMDKWIEGYLATGKIMGIAIYKAGAYVESRLWAVDRSK